MLQNMVFIVPGLMEYEGISHS